MQNISFKIISPDDCQTLHHWLQEKHIREFWDDGDRTLEQVQAHYFCSDDTKRFLFYINQEPAGYIQSYLIDSKNEYNQFVLENKKNIGIDFFIGNTTYLGKGLATTVIEKFVECCCSDADLILVDPTPNNLKSIHVYKKYGFNKSGECEVDGELHWIMTAVPHTKNRENCSTI